MAVGKQTRGHPCCCKLVIIHLWCTAPWRLLVLSDALLLDFCISLVVAIRWYDVRTLSDQKVYLPQHVGPKIGDHLCGHIIRSVICLYVMDTWLKKETEQSNDHHVVLSRLMWVGRLLEICVKLNFNFLMWGDWKHERLVGFKPSLVLFCFVGARCHVNQWTTMVKEAIKLKKEAFAHESLVWKEFDEAIENLGLFSIMS